MVTLDDMQKAQMLSMKATLSTAATGDNFRLARRVLGLSQRDLGAILDYENETLSRWENGHEKIPRVAIVAVVGLLARGILGERPEAILEAATSPQPVTPAPRSS